MQSRPLDPASAYHTRPPPGSRWIEATRAPASVAADAAARPGFGRTAPTAEGGHHPVRALSFEAGKVSSRIMSVGREPISAMATLPDGGIVFADEQPSWGVIAPAIKARRLFSRPPSGSTCRRPWRSLTGRGDGTSFATARRPAGRPRSEIATPVTRPRGIDRSRRTATSSPRRTTRLPVRSERPEAVVTDRGRAPGGGGGRAHPASGRGVAP
jgi:hypothetical protein